MVLTEQYCNECCSDKCGAELRVSG